MATSLFRIANISYSMQDVHMNIARCLLRNSKGFGETSPHKTTLQCKGSAPKSHSPFFVPLKAELACSNNVKSFKKSVSEVRGLHADYVSISEGAAYEVDAAIPAEALINDGAVHLVVGAMDDMDPH